MLFRWQQLVCGLLLWLLAAFPAWAEQVVISKILYHPRDGKPEYLELFNATSNPFDIAGWRLAGGAHFEFPAFFTNDPAASFLRPFERLVVSAATPAATRAAYAAPETARILGPWTGKLSNEGERITLKDKNGVTVCTVKYGVTGRWPAAAEAAGHALVLIDANGKMDDGGSWAVSTEPGGLPGSAPSFPRTSPVSSPEIEATLGQMLVGYDAGWRYQASGREQPARWREPDFDDSGWFQGPGLLGFDLKPLPEPGLNTRLNMGRQITYYFRLRFDYAGGAKPGDTLYLDQILDDGAVYYLNGKEVGRSRLPAGPIHNMTLASSTVPTANEELRVFALDPGQLRPGQNALAVEVHQCKPTSSDVVFGMRLRLTPPPRPGLVINEVYAGAKDGFFEVCNTAATAANLKGCFVSDTLENLRQYSFSADMVLPPGGLARLGLAECGLRNASPFMLYLTAPDGQIVINAITANFSEDGRALGRRPDGGSEWCRFPEPTPGRPNPAPVPPPLNRNTPNTPPPPAAVVINEIMYDPPYGAAGTEYVELFNRGAGPVDLTGWQFKEGITFVFPRGTTLPAGGCLVVAANAARLKRVYGDLPVVGDYTGRLRHGGERVRLVDAAGNVVNEVDFKAGGGWPVLAHGGGSSLELVHPWLDNARGSAWRDSDETGKSTWQTYACTNVYLEQNSLGTPADFREVQLYLVGEGHVALRNIGLWKSGTNYLDPPTRMSSDGSGATGWLAQGNHCASFMTNGELHVVSDGHGDNRADRVETDCVRIKRGERYELRFEGRWISGCPRLVAQAWDRSIGRAFLLALPARPGTPGRPNSVSVPPPYTAAQAAPQADDLRHSPPVPRSTNAVRITARISCPAPLAQVRLFHRPDNVEGDAPWASKPMADDGVQGGDVLAGDGCYTAELTEYMTNETVVQFYVHVRAANGLETLLPRGGAQRPALYVVDDRKIPRDARLFRFVVSAYDLEAMAEGNTPKHGFRHPRLSNYRHNMTFIANEEEVFYGGGIRVSGSPFTRGSELGKGKWDLPGDRPYYGRTKFFFDNDSHFHNRVTRQLLYLLGHVTSQAEWVRVVVNTSGAYLKEDTEPVTGEFLDRNFKGDSHGELYRIDDEWWFTDDWDYQNRDADWEYKGDDDPLHYRTEWQKRTREVEDDFSALMAFFKTYSANRYTEDQMEQWLDTDAVLQMAAVRGYINDWDSFTMQRGKNGYFYRRPSDGRFQFLQWDSDLAFRSFFGEFYSPRVAAWLERPCNKRRFHYYLLQLAELAISPRLNTWFDLEAAATPVRPVNADFYRTFFRQRNLLVLGTLAQSRRVPLAFTTPAGPRPATAGPTLTLSGTAPCSVYRVVLDQDPRWHPVWNNETTWAFPDTPVRPGTNVFVVKGLDAAARPLQQATLTLVCTP